MKNDLYVVGSGPGAPDLLTALAAKIIGEAGCVVAAPRNSALADGHGNILPLKDFAVTFEKIEEELKRGSVAVLVSGDPGMFSLLPLIKKKFDGANLKVIPGISSLQSLCCATAESWEGAAVLSGHGRAVSAARLLMTADRNYRTFFFCGGGNSPKWVCKTLAENGLDSLEVAVGERLSYPDQRISVGSPSSLSRRKFDPLSIALILNRGPWTPPFGRLKDEDFVRTDVPMTKSEVRSIILDKLELTPDAVVWDLGAGTGSIAVSAALMCPEGEVYAVDSEPRAVELEHENRKKFHCFNLSVLQGRCPAAMKKLPKPTHVFVGGSGGELREILLCAAALGKGIRVVVPAVSIQSMCVASEVMREAGFSALDVTQLSVNKSKAVGNSKIMAAQNPVTVFSALTNG